MAVRKSGLVGRSEKKLKGISQLLQGYNTQGHRL